MTDKPRKYEHEFTTPLDYRARRRIGYSHDGGTVTRFVVQLEYRLRGEWIEVVRFDHDFEGEQGHDVTTEGVHMDVTGTVSRYDHRRYFRQCPRTTHSRAPKNT